MSTATAAKPNQHGTDWPEWMTKKQVAQYLQCSLRQVELMVQRGRIAKPVYLGDASPRFRHSELLASLTEHVAAG